MNPGTAGPGTLALPKGRLFDSTADVLSRVGYSLRVEKRQLLAEDPDRGLRAILVKNSDLPTYVHHGIAGLGICGSDVIFESGFDFFDLLTLPFGSTRICLAGLADTEPGAGSGQISVGSGTTSGRISLGSGDAAGTISVGSGAASGRISLGSGEAAGTISVTGDRLKVATKFTRFTRHYFNRLGIPVDIVQLNGSVELAPVLGLAPYIVDLVETGSTLKAHNLEIKAELGMTEVRLIANPAFYKYHFNTVDRFVEEMGSALSTTR